MLSGGLLDYEEYYHYYYKTRFDVRQFTPEEMKAIQKKIAETGMADAECHWWALGVERMDLNAMIALVLTLAPNLEVPDIDMWTRPVGSQQITPMLDLIGRLQRERQLGHPLALWGLKRVVVRYYYDENMADIHSAAATGYGPDIILDIVSLLMVPRWKACVQVTRSNPRCRRKFKHANMMSKVCRLNSHLQDLTILHREYVWSSMINSSAGSLNPFKSLQRLETNWVTFTGWHDGNEATRVVSLSQSIVNAIPQCLELCVFWANHMMASFLLRTMDIMIFH